MKSRNRPKKLVIRERENISHTNLPSAMHERLKMQWSDQPVKDLRGVLYTIKNEGSNTITKPEFELQLVEETLSTELLIRAAGAGA